MWGRVENSKEWLCQYLRTGQLFKSGPAAFHEYVWHGELEEVDDIELQFCRVIFFLSEYKIQKIKLFTIWDIYNNDWDNELVR